MERSETCVEAQRLSPEVRIASESAEGGTRRWDCFVECGQLIAGWEEHAGTATRPDSEGICLVRAIAVKRASVELDCVDAFMATLQMNDAEDKALISTSSDDVNWGIRRHLHRRI